MNPLPQLAVPSISIAGSNDRFPVRRIFCVGQNYADHVREMGSDPDRQPPFFFSKPADSVTPTGQRLPFPSRTTNLHHEIELVVALGKAGADVDAADSRSMIFGYAAGIDLTRRDLQTAARKQRPSLGSVQGLRSFGAGRSIDPRGSAFPRCDYPDR